MPVAMPTASCFFFSPGKDQNHTPHSGSPVPVGGWGGRVGWGGSLTRPYFHRQVSHFTAAVLKLPNTLFFPWPPVPRSRCGLMNSAIQMATNKEKAEERLPGMTGSLSWVNKREMSLLLTPFTTLYGAREPTLKVRRILCSRGGLNKAVISLLGTLTYL